MPEWCTVDHSLHSLLYTIQVYSFSHVLDIDTISPPVRAWDVLQTSNKYVSVSWFSDVGMRGTGECATGGGGLS